MPLAHEPRGRLARGIGGIPFFVGGLLAWWVLSPLRTLWVGRSGRDNRRCRIRNGAIAQGTPVFGFIYGKMIRPLGIGALIGGALMG